MSLCTNVRWRKVIWKQIDNISSQASYESAILARNPLVFYQMTSHTSEYGLPASSQPLGMTKGPEGNVWFTDYGTSKIGKLALVPLNEGEEASPAPGWTMEYNVPVSGSGAPHTMSKTEVETWGQKDTPTEATAIFPPDKRQGWPASSYTRATIYYQDATNHTVNVATPMGGISTAEYDSHNNQTRTLSAANRAVALKEAKPLEASEHLGTNLTYNSEGAELASTLGPEHKVKLPNGSEVQARKQVSYTYEEGAPSEGGPYRLPTKTVEAALVAGKEEDKRTVATSYSGQENLGWKLHKPTSTTVAPGGLNLVHGSVFSAQSGNQMETTMPSAQGQVSEYALPAGSAPYDITSGPDGNLWFTDYASGKTGKITTGGTVTEYAAEPDQPEGITSGPDGNLWFVEHSVRHVNHMTTAGALTVYTLTRTSTYNVGIVTGSDGNLWFTESTSGYVGKINTKNEVLGEYVLPAGSKPYGIAAGPDNNLWVANFGTSKIAKITTTGTITEYALPTGSEPYGITAGPDGNLWFTDYGTNKVGKITTTGTITEYGLPSGSTPTSITTGSEGNLWLTEYGTSKIAKITTSGAVTETALPSASKPQGIAVGPDGNVWFTEEGTNKIGKIGTAVGNPGAYTSQTIYYTPSTEASVAACQNHPEWANLPCQTQPAHQPEVSGMPELPVTIFTYNVWDEPETTKSTSGGSTRTQTNGYDTDGRLTSKETTSTTGASLPKGSYQYSAETGLPTKQSTGSGSEEQKITSEYNKLGQMIGYTDADGATTAYEYENEGDARLTKTTDPKGTQTLKYDETTGAVKELTDSAAGTFTAKYDVEGNLETEGLPNGMTVNTTRNAVAEPTGLEYVKTTHCTENCKWFTDNVTSSIHGQWMSQTSTLSTNTYAYDEAGRLTQVQNTPVGKGCATRIYGLEADGNRTTLTKRAPETGGGCATTGGEVEKHTYDTADRLIDTGTSYNPFGDITALPASDAGGSELTSTYYTDSQLASQTQGGQTVGYSLDPARRTRETVATGTRTSDVTNHYDGAGTTPSWTSYTSGETTRDISGIGSSLDAVQYNTEAPVLQVANLHGDIIAAMPDSETATKLTSAFDTTEYGVPTTAEPPKYSWLGAGEIPTELASGVMDMGARSYVPQLGRFLQPDPQPGGSANAYSYTHGNPLNEADPSGEWSLEETSGGVSAVGTGEGVQLAGGTGIASGAVMPAEVNTQMEEAFWAAPPWDQITAGYEEYEEYEEEGEGEGYEYAAYHQGDKSESEDAGVEEGVLYQPIGYEGEASAQRGSLVRRCTEAAPGMPCVRYVGAWEFIETFGHTAEHYAKKIWHGVKKVWHNLTHHTGRTIKNCAVGGAGYVLVAKLVDYSKLTPVGFAASCVFAAETG